MITATAAPRKGTGSPQTVDLAELRVGVDCWSCAFSSSLPATDAFVPAPGGRLQRVPCPSCGSGKVALRAA